MLQAHGMSFALRCDEKDCKSQLTAVTRPALIDRARAGHWAVFDGLTIGGGELSTHLCPQHSGRGKTEKRIGPMADDQPLF